jgi:uncharacterized protein YjbI with pentapeptide repeats
MKAIETAVAQNINLCDANLQKANLKGAFLLRANLQNADLFRTNLKGAFLWGANLQNAYLELANLEKARLCGASLRAAKLYKTNLNQADFEEAYLCEANFYQANLQNANLKKICLKGADFCQANLQGANLEEADFQGTNLERANLQNAKLSKFQIPQRKSLIVYKKLRGSAIATLRIPSRAARTVSLLSSSPEMRAQGKFGKCRAERAFVVAIEDREGKPVRAGHSFYNFNLIYEVGKEVRPTQNYNSDIRIECTSGIHFFMTKEEAKDFKWL